MPFSHMWPAPSGAWYDIWTLSKDYFKEIVDINPCSDLAEMEILVDKDSERKDAFDVDLR